MTAANKLGTSGKSTQLKVIEKDAMRMLKQAMRSESTALISQGFTKSLHSESSPDLVAKTNKKHSSESTHDLKKLYSFLSRACKEFKSKGELQIDLALLTQLCSSVNRSCTTGNNSDEYQSCSHLHINYVTFALTLLKVSQIAYQHRASTNLILESLIDNTVTLADSFDRKKRSAVFRQS